MVLLHFQVGLIQYVTPQQASQKLKGPQRLLLPFKGEHLEWAWASRHAPIFPKGKPMDSHMIG
jgi:hypothetical protein